MVINKSNDIFRIANTDNITTFETNRIYPLNFCFVVELCKRFDVYSSKAFETQTLVLSFILI